jgi:hypothetical protein
MVRTHIGRGLMAGVLGIGAIVLGSSVAVGASIPMVVSDRAVFAGTASPTGTAGMYNFTSRRCKLSSDAESGSVPCQLSATITFTSANVGNGTATVTSTDGSTSWSFTVSSTNGTNFTMKGSGSEADSPDPGIPPPPPYPCTVHGMMKAVPNSTGGFTVTGSVVMAEAGSAP